MANEVAQQSETERERERIILYVRGRERDPPPSLPPFKTIPSPNVFFSQSSRLLTFT
jgi:hypothetical protein